MKTNTVQKCFGILFGMISLSFILSSCSSTHKAVKLNEADISDMVNSSQFVFVADRVSPMRGGMRNLTSRYSVKVMKDSLNCYLPYFGRATQAPLNMTGGGIEFISSKFSYDVANTKGDQ